MMRRTFFANGAALLGSAVPLTGCSESSDADVYREASAATWREGALTGLHGRAVSEELVRYATLAPSSHNTQCWKFALDEQSITVLPDLSRRCPAVDPDDHHLFVSLGCATENLIQAAQALGLRGEAHFDAARDAVRVVLSPATAAASPMFRAIAQRQSTRAEYDGKPLSAGDLKLLEQAAAAEPVRLLLVTEQSALERVLEFVIQGNTTQMGDKAFVDELKTWIRFNGADAVRAGDGLYAASSGNPTVPAWLGSLMFGMFFTPKAENDKYARHVRSSAGVAVFVGQRADKAHWVEVGRAYERFALQATALGVRTAHLNQPIEVQALRPQFASFLGIGAARPDLVLRFGRGPTLPPSPRRPVKAVLV
jgi:Nitroreductase family